MSIIKNWRSDGFVLCCDCCGYKEVNIPTFDDAVILKKKNGWKSMKIGVAVLSDDGWEDYCPYCVEEKEIFLVDCLKGGERHGGL